MQTITQWIIKGNEEPNNLEGFLGEQLHDDYDSAMDWCNQLNEMNGDEALHLMAQGAAPVKRRTKERSAISMVSLAVCNNIHKVFGK
jgi:hypothetical protein